MARLSAVQENSLGQRFGLPSTAAARFLAHAPYFPRCSDNKTAVLSRPAHLAVRWPYMQANSQDRVSWLVFDCDHGDVLIWEKVGLPEPNLIVSSRKDGVITSFHCFYAILPVCTSAKGRSHPIRYMRAIYEEMAVRLNADTSYHSGPVCKTPGHPWWDTWEIHGREYSLGQLNEYVELPARSPWAKKPDLDDFANSRQCTLFEQLRHYAYSIVGFSRAKGSFEAFQRRVMAEAERLNNFGARGFICFRTLKPKGDLRQSQVRATVKSISRWTWDRYTAGALCNRGVMNLSKEIPLRERQQLSASRTHKLRHSETESKVREAYSALKRQGVAITQAAVARLAKLSRQTVANYKAIFSGAQGPAPVQPCAARADRSEPGNVKFGVHQISTPGADPQGAASFSLFPGGPFTILSSSG